MPFARCLYSSAINFCMPEPVFTRHRTYNGNCAHLNGMLHISLATVSLCVCVCVCVCLFVSRIVAGQRLGKILTEVNNIDLAVEELLDLSFSLQFVLY
jgi:hypothetical protein